MLIKVPNAHEINFDELNNALKECASLQDKDKWNLLKNQFINDIKFQLGGYKDPNANSLMLLDTFRGFPQEIDSLLKGIYRIESNTRQYKELLKVISGLAKNQQKEKGYNIVCC